MRVVVDFRRLNEMKEPDRYPLPLLRDVLHSLGRDNVVFTLHLMNGFYQIPSDTKSKESTAFSTNKGDYTIVFRAFDE